MMKLVSKYLPYVAIGLIVLAFGLLAIPGSFFTYAPRSYNGYQAIFYADTLLQENATFARASVGGIIAMSLAVLAVPFFFLVKKSSASYLLAGVLTAVSGTLVLAMKLWFAIIYRGNGSWEILWVTYVIGALLLVAGGLAIYSSIVLLNEEKASPLKSKGYSYIKK